MWREWQFLRLGGGEKNTGDYIFRDEDCGILRLPITSCADNRVDRFQSWVFLLTFFFFFVNQQNQKSKRWQNHWECPPPLCVFFYNRHSSNISLGGCQATPPLNSPLTHKSNASDWCSHRSNRFYYHIKASCLQSLSESSRSQQIPAGAWLTVCNIQNTAVFFLWNYCYVVHLNKKRSIFLNTGLF